MCFSLIKISLENKTAGTNNTQGRRADRRKE